MDLMVAWVFAFKLAAVAGLCGYALKSMFPSGDIQTTKDLMRHTYCIGETGTGKSTKCKNDILNVINQGYGCLYIDIHGKDSLELLDLIPPEHIDRVIYIDPANANSVIGFPLFDGDSELAVDALISIFDTIWPGFIGPSTEDILRMAALAVVPNKGNLLDLYSMIVDEHYRDGVKILDPTVEHFWRLTFPDLIKKDKSRLNPPTNKLRKLIMSRVARVTLCQSNPLFNLQRLMDDNAIVICNFSKGAIGHDTSRLLSALMVCKLQLCLFSRSESSNPFFCFLDEFQNYVTKSFPEILSESRKYNISLNLYHQYFNQLPDYLRHAIRGNVGSRYAFRVDDDAKLVAEMFDLETDDIKNLENFYCYAKRLIDGKKEHRAILLPPSEIPEVHGYSNFIIRNSAKYGYPPQQVLDEFTARLSQSSVSEDDIL